MTLQERQALEKIVVPFTPFVHQYGFFL